MGYINPLFKLPAAQKLLELPAAQRAALEALFRELRAQSGAEAEKSWRRSKAPMAAYWKAVSTYARHIAHALSKGTGGAGAPPFEAGLTFGIEVTVADEAPVEHWYVSRVARDQAVQGMSLGLRRAAANQEVRAIALVRLPDGSVHTARGAAALHEQWRPTVFRASHKTLPSYMDQAAIVDVVTGRVLIADRGQKYKVGQHATYTRELCLEEYSINKVKQVAWPSVRSAVEGEGAHYMVARKADLHLLQSHTAPPADLLQQLDTALAVKASTSQHTDMGVLA